MKHKTMGKGTFVFNPDSNKLEYRFISKVNLTEGVMELDDLDSRLHELRKHEVLLENEMRYLRRVERMNLRDDKEQFNLECESAYGDWILVLQEISQVEELLETYMD